MEVLRVQSIASRTLDTIPSKFIRPESERPDVGRIGRAPQLPVIDLSNPDQESLVQDMAKAAQEWGIFQIINHGIPQQVVEELQRVGKEFFELPQVEKERIARNSASPALEGYGTQLQKDLQGKLSWVDFLFHNIWPPSRINFDKWPKKPASYTASNEEYAKHLQNVVDKLLGTLSLGLGIEEEVLKKSLGGDEFVYLLKINYYPPCPRPDLTLGVVAHTDMSALTVLVPNDVPGLQVCKDDQWFIADYIPNALIVHIGDQIEILSNGKYKSVLHRTTVNKEKARMSWPVFCSPPDECMIGPLPHLTDETNNPPKYKTKSFKDYAYCKLNKLPQ
ncbi:hypothetical protein AMTRI_Chr04g183840 [Amborella trichopoda]|uniref:Fe2OG dioxygenase domain-containing protein n=1 Tax=Amborella trichopoda TaxID=13333 RepID=W1NQS0_AMBTC|nr:flavonol synthase/flavanone 3-hydroxylase [Amborella trichopoda]ERM97315.1 hypothetical protein AMTR_s00073p00054080 [Amborella trichopoda]|eukprot:XP_006829899.1 flavonol synthase/flavanone 3-hydroxylase [Amborella trichopoda]